MLIYASISKIGNRKCNEDCVRISTVSDRHCFVLCDGLGGHGSGDIAAQIVGNVFVDCFSFCDNIQEFLDVAFYEAQNKVMRYQKNMNSRNHMKTTTVCMVTDGKNIHVGHIGDSRFYAFTNNNSYIRTFDHSVPQLLYESKTIDESEIRNHPNRSMLLKVIGSKWDEAMYEAQPTKLLNDFRAFLLCSDGFWEHIIENEMIATLSASTSPKEWLSKMTSIVEMQGKGKNMDNYSAIAILNIL